MKATLAPEIPIEQLPTLSQLFEAMEPASGAETPDASASDRARWAWHAAIAAMAHLLKQAAVPTAGVHDGGEAAKVCNLQGIVFSGPTPVFSDLAILAHFKNWVFAPEGHSYRGFQLPPASASSPAVPISTLPTIPLSQGDPLAGEQFCLVQTPRFCWVAVLGFNADGIQQFQFSFEPATVQQIWRLLQVRVMLSSAKGQCAQIQQWQQRYPVLSPDYRIPIQFSRELLRHAAYPTAPHPILQTTNAQTGELHPDQSLLRHPSPHSHTLRASTSPSTADGIPPDRSTEDRDVELLKVLSHEVRTPLTTIQTLTCLLLKRSDLPIDVIKRLEAIQRECKGQINRFGLIFRAMELTHDACQTLPNRLTPMSLQEVLEDNLVRWQTHAARRNLTFEITTPKQLPAIAIRDPHLLDQVLTGLMEYLSYSLSAGSHIHLQVALAGPQLKLELKTQPNTQTDAMVESPILKAVGQLLMFQPETGGLSLSLPATKHLFQALGGKLTVRKHLQGEVLTIFLPLGTESDAY
jgi:hypothetical protein